MAGAHNQRVIAQEGLEVVDFAEVGAVGRVFGDDLDLLPDALEIIFLHGAAVAVFADGRHTGDAVARVGGGDGDLVAELIEGDLLFDGVGVFDGDLRAGEGPLHLYGAEAFLDFFLGVDQFGLLVAEEEAVAQPEAGDTAAAVEGGQGNLFAEGELGGEDRRVDVIGPVEDSRRVREG